jgi:hypothetical protein
LADSGDAWDAEELTRAILTAAAPHIAAAERERILRQLSAHVGSSLVKIVADVIEPMPTPTEGGQADGT